MESAEGGDISYLAELTPVALLHKATGVQFVPPLVPQDAERRDSLKEGQNGLGNGK